MWLNTHTEELIKLLTILTEYLRESWEKRSESSLFSGLMQWLPCNRYSISVVCHVVLLGSVSFLSHPSILSDPGLIINSVRISPFRTFHCSLAQGLPSFFSQGQEETYCCVCHVRAARGDMERNGRGWAPIKFYLQKQAAGDIWPQVHSLGMPALASHKCPWPWETAELLCPEDTFLPQFGGLCTLVKVWLMYYKFTLGFFGCWCDSFDV